MEVSSHSWALFCLYYPYMGIFKMRLIPSFFFLQKEFIPLLER